jgi:hypothetical protein
VDERFRMEMDRSRRQGGGEGLTCMTLRKGEDGKNEEGDRSWKGRNGGGGCRDQ